MSTNIQGLVLGDHDRPKTAENAKKDMWSSMLDSVASGKRLPEKNILVLGGSPDSQKEFLESLSSESSSKSGQDRYARRQAPLANNYALGYTFLDVLDSDHEDLLARLSIYLLSDPSLSFTPLLRPLVTPNTIAHTIVVILLDWCQPWDWVRQLRDWVGFLRSLISSLDQDCVVKMEENMRNWLGKNRVIKTSDENAKNILSESDVTLPLGPGEWDEPLGLPICVVCQNCDQMEILEREQAWKEEDFDYVLQYLRTILLKHGASLVYTHPSASSQLPGLIHSSLGIQSLLKQQAFKHNVIDRDKVLVPSNWDSWGKIRVLRDGFDVEAVSQGWNSDIGNYPYDAGDQHPSHEGAKQTIHSALRTYEDTIQRPNVDTFQLVKTDDGITTTVEVQSLDTQAFLAEQLENLERIRHTTESPDARQKREGSIPNVLPSEIDENSGYDMVEEGRVHEHIGPVQFNMGGIQVDADDMLQRLKDRQSHEMQDSETPPVAFPEGKSQNGELASFFAGLLKRGGGSVASSPKPGS